MTTPKEKKKLSMTLDCMIHCTNRTDLVTLESVKSWKTLLHAARVQTIKEF